MVSRGSKQCWFSSKNAEHSKCHGLDDPSSYKNVCSFFILKHESEVIKKPSKIRRNDCLFIKSSNYTRHKLLLGKELQINSYSVGKWNKRNNKTSRRVQKRQTKQKNAAATDAHCFPLNGIVIHICKHLLWCRHSLSNKLVVRERFSIEVNRWHHCRQYLIELP